MRAEFSSHYYRLGVYVSELVAVLFEHGETPYGKPQFALCCPYDADFVDEVKELRLFFDRDKKVWLFEEEKKASLLKKAKKYYNVVDLSVRSSLARVVGSKDHKLLHITEDAPPEVIDAAYKALVAPLKDAKIKRKYDIAYDRIRKTY